MGTCKETSKLPPHVGGRTGKERDWCQDLGLRHFTPVPAKTRWADRSRSLKSPGKESANEEDPIPQRGLGMG